MSHNMVPDCGQLDGGVSSGLVSKAASAGSSEYSRTLSTDVIWFSVSTLSRMPIWNVRSNPMELVRANPASPPFKPAT